jgi:flavorubredoxin
MQPVEIKKNVYWVGGIDWDLRNFHGYLTQRGSTYNAYLIVDEKITLIDTVKHYLADEMLSRIAKVTDPAKIDYVISNHVEMDHSGTLPEIAKIAPKARVITSPNGEKGLKAHFGNDLNLKVVKNGESLNIGSRELQFVLTPMVHWPDNMVTYSPSDKILFSNDAFGQHLATAGRFDDEYPLDIILFEAGKYYANIVLPYSGQVQKALEAAGKLALDVIAPSHGMIWRAHIPKILGEYRKWAAQETENTAVVVYDTMWHSTEKMARAVAEGFEEKGVRAVLRPLAVNHISDVMTDILTAKYVCVGSPTLNNQMLPTVAAFLTYLKGLVPQGRTGLAFGSYGWGGQSVGQIEAALREAGFDLWESLKVKYIPDQAGLAQIKKSVLNKLSN